MSRKTIMSVDDASLFRIMVKDTLTKQGYECITAQDAEEAIEIYQAEKPDLVLMDIVMPGKDGITCTKEIIHQDPQALIIILSAMATPVMLFSAIESGAKDFITKPFQNENLFNKINQTMSSIRKYDMNVMWDKLAELDPRAPLTQIEIDRILVGSILSEVDNHVIYEMD